MSDGQVLYSFPMSNGHVTVETQTTGLKCSGCKDTIAMGEPVLVIRPFEMAATKDALCTSCVRAVQKAMGA